MTGHVYRLSSSFELPLDDLESYLDDPDLPAEVESIEVTRRNNKLLVSAVAADDSISKYTPTAQLKGSVEEKRVYEEEEDARSGWKRQQEEEERESELVEMVSFSGDLGGVLQNSALQYPMFLLLREIARIDDVDGSLTAITAVDSDLEVTRVVDGEDRPASIEVVEDPQAGDAADSDTGVDWRGNQFISD